MAKWGVNTQIGLVKELLKRGIVATMILILVSLGNSQIIIRRRIQPRRRNEIDITYVTISSRFI
ncbi:MAG: hypothetical protein LIP01_15305 [Tannerellaceae bacterium]|nr:hypothetical protein [Tannerellaceae bacterium]